MQTNVCQSLSRVSCLKRLQGKKFEQKNIWFSDASAFSFISLAHQLLPLLSLKK